MLVAVRVQRQCSNGNRDAAKAMAKAMAVAAVAAMTATAMVEGNS